MISHTLIKMVLLSVVDMPDAFFLLCLFLISSYPSSLFFRATAAVRFLSLP